MLKGVAALKTFLEKGQRPISMQEMTEFWKSLTQDEKTEYTTYAEKIVNAEVTA